MASGRLGLVRVWMMGDLPGTTLETAKVTGCDGPIGTGSSFPPRGGSSLGHLAGGLRLRTCTQVGSGELDSTPLTIKSDEVKMSFLCVFPLFFLLLSGAGFL